MIQIDGQDEIASTDFGKFGEQIKTDGQRMDGLHLIKPISSTVLISIPANDDHTVWYLSGLPDSFGSSGMIVVLPIPRYSYCPYY
jgi:hypothetical protein